MKAKHCNECQGYNLTTISSQVCKLGHRVRFYLPKSPIDYSGGWKRACADFAPTNTTTEKSK
jgi:hypothetical protein